MNLDIFRKAYYDGKPLISNEHYDALLDIYDEDDSLGGSGDLPHKYSMYSLQKVWDEDPIPVSCKGKELVESPKLDGSAISLLYKDGILVQGLTRGDGVLGKDISDKVLVMESIPNEIKEYGYVQITGEVVTRKDAKNARNASAGAFGLKDIAEFKQRELYFVAYSFKKDRNIYINYTDEMNAISIMGFVTILDITKDQYRTDGLVYRINNVQEYESVGFTSKFPKGAFSRKKRADVEVKETTLLDVTWQVGGSGKVTPVGHIEEIVIDDAKIKNVTIHNVGYVEELDLDIGDTLLITRSGGVIPKILANVTKGNYLYED